MSNIVYTVGFLTVARYECFWVPLPPVLQTAGSSLVAPPLASTAGEEEPAVAPRHDAVAIAVGRDNTDEQVTKVMEMGIREHRDRISRLAVALLALGIVEHVIVAEDTVAVMLAVGGSINSINPGGTFFYSEGHGVVTDRKTAKESARALAAVLGRTGIRLGVEIRGSELMMLLLFAYLLRRRADGTTRETVLHRVRLQRHITSTTSPRRGRKMRRTACSALVTGGNGTRIFFQICG